MHYLITGATGFIGSSYITHLTNRGAKITALVRNRDKAAKMLGPAVNLVTDLDQIDDDCKIDVIINLAGAPIADAPWTQKRRQILLSSRLDTTFACVHLCQRLRHKPALVISGSAAGYYGRCGAEVVDENSPPQDIFMSMLCQQWEKTAQPIADMGIRLVIPRTSVVLGRSGVALSKLALPHRLGLGARFGAGDHYFPWIHLQDMHGFFDFAVENPSVSGAYNMTTDDTHTQHSFNQQLAKALHRPYFMRAPKGLLRLMMGDLSDLFVEGQNLSAAKINASGFKPKFPKLEQALADIL